MMARKKITKKPAKPTAENSAKRGGRGRPFQPGQSGNPGGRPRTAEFNQAVREFLAERTHGKPRLRRVLERLQKHDPKMLLYYAYGKPVESVALANPDGSAVMEPLAVAIAQAVARLQDATPNPP